MSSSDEESRNTGQGKSSAKRPRRVARACDFCRRRKIRCDGGQGPGGKCGTCTSMNKECSYVVNLGKDGGPKGYVEALEYKLSKMELLLKRLHPDEDFSSEVGIHITRDNWMVDGALGDTEATEFSPFASGSAPSNSAARRSTKSAAGMPIRADDPAVIIANVVPSDDEEDLVVKLKELDKDFKSMHVGSFFGKASGPQYVKKALEIKMQAQEETPANNNVNWAYIQRPTYWSLTPWERDSYEKSTHAYEFPDPDLLVNLVKLYFVHEHPYNPILHRPTFERDIRKGIHFHQDAFGGVVLLVCAIAARHSDDPRVVLDSEPESNTALSAGWKWFIQVKTDRRERKSTSRLHDLQIYALASTYSQGVSRTSACWSLIGLGLRLAQDLGCHKQKVYGKTPSIEDECFKRTFWSLICQDRITAVVLGRPLTIQEEDMDVEMPLDCDDEYWDTPERKQPPGKPSQASYYVSYIKLMQILGLAIRTIYASSRTKALYGFKGVEWAQRTVSNFDSVLNNWVDSLPDHLRWNPTCEDGTFWGQSAHLYAFYYNVQILVHRPFIADFANSSLSFPSLAICLNAARSVTRIIRQMLHRDPVLFYPQFTYNAQSAAVTLLLGIWSVKRSGLAIDVAREMENIHDVIKYMAVLETRLFTPGRLRDVLRTLMSLTGLPMPDDIPTRRKRDRDPLYDFGDQPAPLVVDSGLSPMNVTKDRPIAGSNRAQAALRSPALSHITSASSGSGFGGDPFAAGLPGLPTLSNDLGRMAPDDPFRGLYSTSTGDDAMQGVFGGQYVFGSGNNMPFESALGSFGLGAFPMDPSAAAPKQPDGALMPGFDAGLGGGMNAWASVPTGYGDTDWDVFLKQLSGPAVQATSQETTPSSVGYE